jgi:uncharacterized SAM-dependent methyltransferase
VRCHRGLADVPGLKVREIRDEFLSGLENASRWRQPGEMMLVLFLGGTIGNFERRAAVEFLRALRETLQPGDALLLGTDHVQPEDRLLDAYDDPTGVTAAFNLNLLARINRELEADFDLRQFEHVIRYSQEAQRIEMHLRAKSYQIVSVRKADLIVDFVPNETICTEACHKFVPNQIFEMARAAGFRVDAAWMDDEWLFAESLFVAI